MVSLNEPAPIDAEALEPVLRPFGESRMPPHQIYLDDALFAWEQRHFFGGGWACVGRSADVARVGDQRAATAGSGGVLLMRGEDGVLRGFVNACRHRGHELLPCDGSAQHRSVVCPYHAWSYALDGSLRAAPGFRRFDRSEYGLTELPVTEWHGWIFVDGSGTAGPLSEHIGALEDIVAPYAPAALSVRASHDYVVAANWKVIVENYQECYHCSMIHPELCRVSPPRSGDNYDLPGNWVGGWMDLSDHAQTMSLSGAGTGVALAGLDDTRLRTVNYVAVFPNLLISLHPDYVMTHRLTPLRVDRTRIECAWAFPAEATARAGFDPSYAVDFWDLTNRQDWAACESVQRGLSAARHEPGPLAPDEDGVYHFVTLLARRYLNQR
jgi:Rieske 2Fe-2S family protein